MADPAEREAPTGAEMGAGAAADGAPSRPRGGRPRKGGYVLMRTTMRSLTTRRLDGRSAVAVAARRWKADVESDLGGDLTRAQETVLELAAQTWVMVQALDDWIMRQPSLVNARKRMVVPALLQRQQLADSLCRQLERLGLERKVREVTLDDWLEQRAAEKAKDQEPPPTG